MRTIAVYSGRFHPSHLGHKAVYNKLVQQFGQNNVYIATSDKQAPMSSPFTFEQKQFLWTELGVPQDKVVLVKNPYKPTEITSKFDTNETSIVFAVSEKDSDRFSFNPKKDGSPSYMQPYQENKELNPISQTGYVLLVPTVEFKILDKPVSGASDIRGMYIKAKDDVRNKILNDLYGKVNPKVKAIYDKQLSMTEKTLVLLSKTYYLTEGKLDKRNTILEQAEKLELISKKAEFNYQ